jgi:signal peptidase I
MHPTLNHGDRVLALSKWPARWLRRGQLVLIWPWLPAARALRHKHKLTPFIKRVIGIAGDTLVTSIDDLDQDFWPDHLQAHDTQGMRTWHIPPRHIFVRSDNLPGGYDSLSWGPVPYHTVLGIVILRLSPQHDPHLAASQS